MKKQLLFLKRSAAQVFLLFMMFFSFISMGSVARAQSVAGDYVFSYVTGSLYNSFNDGNPIGTNTWDDFNSVNVSLGFNFYFNGSTYTSCYVNANGYITFGTTAPANNDYSPISSTRSYEGVVAAFAKDLYYSGTDNVSSRIRYKTTGLPGNKIFTVQWTDARRWKFDGKFNFQIKLYEGSNTVDVHYGSNSEVVSSTDLPVQVGLRGKTNSDFNNRTTTSNWAATSAGSTNSATNSTTATVRPVPGSIYRWILTKFTASTALYGSGTWIAPCGPTEITVEAWGAGGAGGKATNAGPNGGGGGGAYSRKTFNVSAGDSFAYTVGMGGSGSGNNNSRDGSDSWFGSASFILAKAGTGVRNNTYTGSIGGQSSASIGDITFSGGNGGTPTNSGSHSGGGGGAAKFDGDGSSGGVNTGGVSISPGGSGGNGARNDDGFLDLGYGYGSSGSNYGGGGGGGRAVLGWIDMYGGDGGPGYILVSYSYPNTGAPPPVTAISVLSTDPTTDIGCVNNTVTLQASGGNTGAGVSTLWVKGSSCPTFAYVQEFMGTSYTTTQTTVGKVISGNRLFTSTGDDPNIDMENVLTSAIDPAVHKYIVIRYRVVSGGGGFIQIYIKKSGLILDESRMVSAPLNADGNWHIMNINMSGNYAWNSTGGNITGWRFDYATGANKEMIIDYLVLSSKPIEENTNADDTQITVDAVDENTVFRSLRIADQAALCNGTIPYTSCIPVTLHRSDKTFVATVNNNWDNANNWSFAGIPDNSNCVFVKNSKNLIVNTPIAAAKSIHVSNNSTVTITTNNALSITNSITNLGNGSNFIVESDGNLLQIENAAQNVGNITVKRDAQLKRLDYNYWASPVAGQNLKVFSPGTLNNRFYTYNESNDLFDVIDPLANNFANNGKGYAIRAPNNYTTALQTFVGKFVGAPSNGIKASTLEYTDSSRGFNLIGNPYPSNLNFYSLYADNSELIYNTAYFWTNINPNPEMQGNGYPGDGELNNYAVLNGIGGVSATTPADGGFFVPNEYIKVGQGFIVKAKKAGTLNFDNNIRTPDNSGHFFNRYTQTPVDRYWLHLTTPLNVITTQLIGYKMEATNDFELDYDAPLFVVGADAFYSLLGERKLAIQGKAPFVETDILKLGSRQYAAGNYTISLGNREGIFAGSQNIYLKDKQTGTVTNLSEGEYTFAANAGESTGRFEIIYKPEIVLVTDSARKEELVVYRDAQDFVVKAQTKKISDVEVYDSSGRMIYKIQPNDTTAVIHSAFMPQGVYILKITTADGAVISKKILK